MANEEKNVEVTKTVIEETVESTITTKEALKAIGHNAKVKAKETWEKAKPKLKKAAVVTGVIVGAAVLMDKINGQNAIEKSDDEWKDDTFDVVDGDCTVFEMTAEETDTATNEVAETNATE